MLARVIPALSLLLLAAAPPAPESPPLYLTADGAHIYYEECGQGPAVVLLHDGLLHAVTWDAVWPTLCRDFHVVRYDRRGMGRSDPPKAPFLPVEDLARLLASLKIEKATLVGSSSGAGLAIDFAIRHPAGVERLILLGPVVHGMASSDHFNERGARNNAPLARGDAAAAAKNWADDPYQLAPGESAARRAFLAALTANPQNLRYTGDLEQHYQVPAIARLAEIRVPTLIMVGAGDIPDVHAYAGAIETGIWNVERLVVPKAGHLIQMEQPALVAAKIAGFIADHPVVALPPAALEALAGSYEPLFGRRGAFVVRDGQLVMQVPAEKDLPLFAASPTRFYALVWGGFELDFGGDDKDAVTGVDVHFQGKVERAARLAAPGAPHGS